MLKWTLKHNCTMIKSYLWRYGWSSTSWNRWSCLLPFSFLLLHLIPWTHRSVCFLHLPICIVTNRTKRRNKPQGRSLKVDCLPHLPYIITTNEPPSTTHSMMLHPHSLSCQKNKPKHPFFFSPPISVKKREKKNWKHQGAALIHSPTLTGSKTSIAPSFLLLSRTAAGDLTRSRRRCLTCFYRTPLLASPSYLLFSAIEQRPSKPRMCCCCCSHCSRRTGSLFPCAPCYRNKKREASLLLLSFLRHRRPRGHSLRLKLIQNRRTCPLPSRLFVFTFVHSYRSSHLPDRSAARVKQKGPILLSLGH